MRYCSRTRYKPLLLLLMFVVANNCGVPADSLESKDQLWSVENSSVDATVVRLSADQAWSELISFSPPVATSNLLPGTFQRFILEAEAWKRNWRDQGISYWADFPNDMRRYDWLLLSVHLAPAYAKDPLEWANNQVLLGTSCFDIEGDIENQWNALYSNYRSEFLGSSDVTEYQKRFLRFGELRNELRSHRRLGACGNVPTIVDTLDKIVDYAAAFPEPLGTRDSAPYRWSLSVLLQEILRRKTEWSIDEEDVELFLRRLRSTGEQVTSVVDSTVKSLATEELQRDELVNGDEFEAGSEVWFELPWQFYGDTTSTASRVVFFHDRELTLRRLRASGRVLWENSNSPRGRMYWLMRATFPEPYYAKNFGPAMFSLAAKNKHDYALDTGALDEWEDAYLGMRNEVWSSENISDSARANLRVAEIRHLASRVPSEVARNGSSAKAKALLSGIHELYSRYGGASEFATFFARRLAGMVVHNPTRYGLSTAELQSFLEPMLDYDDVSLRDIAEGWLRVQALYENPIELAVPTLAGRPFDVADLRGKIVLLEFWTTTCSACIAAMPTIHDIYLRYQDRGFEVVSVNFDADRNRGRVERIEEELGLTWPTLNAEAQWQEANSRFGWGNILPQYMLLDRDGTLVAGTAEVDLGRNLEALLGELLTKEITDSKATTVQ